MLEVYSGRKPPVTGTVDPDKLEQRAREALKDHHGKSNDYLFLISKLFWCILLELTS